ncbi:hypothetical protein BVH03_22000 [Pseudomonas sp. PA15(2017)]|uniref:DUF4376 domain-containing protein n=1 Tax=Pseudomonas sp. PA15(2017) TaxID=1932111 RepID=UPI0009628D73|nr:hypothetical protein [Pseudomonas sp. PA15(2017)]OLU22927.1 hypothetical protein BVH03_22000 [Pseudomonas sp. PA15(2017)]
MNIDFSKIITASDKQAKQEQALRDAFKLARAAAVKAITVTTASGQVFDGDETSQGRMARAILGLESAGDGATVRWVLHDNTSVDVGAPELREALALAGQAQADLWVQPQG